MYPWCMYPWCMYPQCMYRICCIHDACIHDACVHDTCIHDAYIYDPGSWCIGCVNDARMYDAWMNDAFVCDADAVTPISNNRSYTRQSVPSSPWRSFVVKNPSEKILPFDSFFRCINIPAGPTLFITVRWVRLPKLTFWINHKCIFGRGRTFSSTSKCCYMHQSRLQRIVSLSLSL